MPGWVLPSVIGVLLGIVVGAVVWSYKATRRLGAVDAALEAQQDLEAKRKKFDEVMSQEIPKGADLLDRLRRRGGVRDGKQ